MNMEEIQYRESLELVITPFMDRLKTIKEIEIREFFEVILDATERSLRGILFMAPSQSTFETKTPDKISKEEQTEEKSAFSKLITKEETDFWFRRVSLALVAYSYYFFSIDGQDRLAKFSYDAYWQRIFDSYNRIFSEKITIDNINYYASGLREDTEKGYSKSGEIEKSVELSTRDYQTIGEQLLREIWKEETTSSEKKGLFIGIRIWQAYQQIVQPFLIKLSNYYRI